MLPFLPPGLSAAPLALTECRRQIRVLQQMTQLIMMHPERLRERTEEQKDIDQTNWVRWHSPPAGPPRARAARC